MDRLREVLRRGAEESKSQKLKIERVIFNAPATIVFWNDGTKTVVKCQNCNICNPFFRAEDGGCCFPFVSKKWKQEGLYFACLKKAMPNYLTEIEKVLGNE